MVHGVYLKSRIKGKWHLYSVAMTHGQARADSNIALKEALRQGNENAEVGIQTFDSSFYIPELLSEIKEQPSIMN